MNAQWPHDGPVNLSHTGTAKAGPLRRGRATTGFTLVEMLVAVAIVAILSAVATPSFTDMMVRTALRSVSSDLGSDLNYARSEAVRTGTAVSVCARASAASCGVDWSAGWLVFREAGAGVDGLLEAGEPVLRDHGAATNSIVVARDGAGGPVTFLPGGSTLGSAAITFTVRRTGVKGRDLQISPIGRLSTKVES